MAPKKTATVAEYLDSLPDDRKKALGALRKVIRKNLSKGFKETMNWGMISYEVPLSTYPETYNGQPLMFAAIASQKNHMAIYLMCVYMDKDAEKALRAGYKDRGLKLDMGKSCIRFKKIEDVPLDLIGEVIGSFTLKDFISRYEKVKSKR